MYFFCIFSVNKIRMKAIYTFAIFLCFSLFLSAQNITTSVIKPPAQLRCSDVPARLNNVVFGAIPPNAQNQPVVIFVHGWFDNGYSWFMAKNKWYESAYNQGYRTAFFFHSYSDEFEKNGKVIAQMIRETCKHYNTDKVVAICHSKGGYDMDYALYNENVWDSVQGVITMSTPYYGAPIADLISNPLIRSIVEIIPIVGPIFKGKGTYQMQTAYMAGVVRPMIDNHPNNRPDKFHCFAGWGFDHKTVLPSAINDDILKVVFKDYQPLCIDIPGFGTFAGDLMSTGMAITGNISKLIQVQDRYNNPSRNQQYNDGLAPYYSSIRPGSTVISQAPPAQQSYINHIDELFSSTMWNIVQPEIEYFKNNPVLRKSNTINSMQDVQAYQAPSNLQLIQASSISTDNAANNKLYLVGEYKNETIKVFDESNTLIKTLPLNVSTQAMLDIFHEIDLTTLPANKKYTLQSSVPITGLFQDGNNASIVLNTNADKTYFADEPLNIEVGLNDWTDNMDATNIKGFLNRNIDGDGNVIYDKVIPVTFDYNDATQTFICKDKIALEDGVYNVSVYVEGNKIKRFATTSILMKQERKSSIKNEQDVIVFPNPANDNVTIQFNAHEINTYAVEIFDVVGKKLFEKNMVSGISGIQQIHLSTKENNLSKGAYLISININGERKSTKVFVVN